MTTTGRRVYVVDDDALVRQTLDDILDDGGYDVKPFVSGQAFMDAAETLGHGCVLLDVKMPGMDGLEVLEELSKRQIRFEVVMVSGYGDIGTAVKAVRSGARDFLEKPFTPQQVVDVVEAAFLAARRIDDDTSSTPLENTPLAVLRPRELEVLKLILEGDPNKVVAYKLDISIRTVEVHRSRLMERLNVRTFAELVRLAIASGL